MGFKQNFSFQHRKDEANRVLQKYPDKVPVICEKNPSAPRDCPNIDKIKYLVPFDLTMGQFLFIIRNRMKLPSEKAIFIFVDNNMVSSSAYINQIYASKKSPDNFLYITYSLENVFG
jgi:GABA(A) receptor-associated protein